MRFLANLRHKWVYLYLKTVAGRDFQCPSYPRPKKTSKSSFDNNPQKLDYFRLTIPGNNPILYIYKGMLR